MNPTEDAGDYGGTCDTCANDKVKAGHSQCSACEQRAVEAHRAEAGMSRHCDDRGVRAVREGARDLLADLDTLVAESRGVCGLHLNGDEADWDEIVDDGRYERLRLTALRLALEASLHDEINDDLEHDTSGGRWK